MPTSSLHTKTVVVHKSTRVACHLLPILSFVMVASCANLRKTFVDNASEGSLLCAERIVDQLGYRMTGRGASSFSGVRRQLGVADFIKVKVDSSDVDGWRITAFVEPFSQTGLGGIELLAFRPSKRAIRDAQFVVIRCGGRVARLK
jgi:hypothetical protein